jgi:intein-encoded DNA endonuclease-like protein
LRRKLLAYWGEILELKDGGMGFRPIALYLAKNRKIKVSPTYLSRLWREVKAND